MLVIVAHHYVVNSGVSQAIFSSPKLTLNNIFLLLFGWGGKTGINCFILITGYFMCKSRITIRKYLKLYLWLVFYRVILYTVFSVSGYTEPTVINCVKLVLPFTSIATDFASAFMAFYLMIPFLNILINAMNKKQHLTLIALCVLIYTVMPTLLMNVIFNYVIWFSVLYLISAYIRIYPENWFENERIWGIAAIAAVIVSWISICGIAYVTLKFTGRISGAYYFVADSNKPLALATAICAFMYFKNINIGYHKMINTIAASAFGVLLIHANSDAMRQWLWKDTLKNVEYMNSNMVFVHAFASVIGIYVICTAIDLLRFNIIEKPFFRWHDKIVSISDE